MDTGLELPTQQQQGRLDFDAHGLAPPLDELDMALDIEEEEDDIPEKHIVDHPVVRRQNNYFLFALVLCVLCFAVYAVSNVYFRDDPVLEELDNPDRDGHYQSIGIKHLPGAAGTMHHTKGTGKDYLRKKKELDAWHNTTVTLQDGIRYKVLEQLVHDKNAFTEGLALVNGRLFESVGLYHKSDLRELDPITGQVVRTWPMPPEYFAEGLTYVDGKLLQLTYRKNTGFIYNVTDLAAPPQTFPFQTITHEGWGMTYDKKRKEIIVSDGSDFLLIWDPVTLQETRRVKVQRQFGKRARNINELEYWRDRVIANVWYEDTLLVIHPETGVVEKEYDFQHLYPISDRRRDHADVLNGIAISDDPDILYVTGKKWDRMFKIKLL